MADPSPTTLSSKELLGRALTLAKRLLAAEGHTPPLAYSHRVPVAEPLPEKRDDQPPVDVDLDRYEPEPPRTRVRFGIWKLCAEVSVEHDDGAKELMAWRNRTEALRRGSPTVDREGAISVAKQLIGDPPRNARGPNVSLVGQDKDDQTYQITWAHFVPENVLVDGDLLLVRVNAATGRPYTLFRKWRTVPPERENQGGLAGGV